MSGSRNAQSAFWSTSLFQIFLVIPLLVTFSVDAQDRLPRSRVLTWPLTETQRLLLACISFALHPLIGVLLVALLLWMGAAVAVCFLILAIFVHLAVYAARRVRWGTASLQMQIPVKFPTRLQGVCKVTGREVVGTLDFWTAVLISITGALYRILGHSPEPEAFPILALFVSIAMSTIAQRLMSLDEGRSRLRYRLWPIAPWKVLVAQDAAFLLLVGLLVLPLNLQGGLACTLVTLAIGRYPSVTQAVTQRRWRFTGGDLRFGAAQVVIGGAVGLGAARIGAPFVFASIAIYVASVLLGQYLWERSPPTP